MESFTLQATNISTYPIPSGTFESMIFPHLPGTSPGRQNFDVKAFRTLVEQVQANDKKTKFLLMQAAQKMRSQQEVICASAKRNLMAKGRKTPRNSWCHFLRKSADCGVSGKALGWWQGCKNSLESWIRFCRFWGICARFRFPGSGAGSNSRRWRTVLVL